MEYPELAVLLVEPSGMQRRLILQQLEHEHVGDIRCVSTGRDALDESLRWSPDLVISAMYLPDMTATELLANIRDEPALSHLPFMLISSEMRFSELDPIRQAGVVAILPKPFTRQQLHRALETTMEHAVPESLSLNSDMVSSARVLIVDDSRVSRMHIRRVLGHLGFRNFSEASNGSEALDRLHHEPVDLIVSDLNMPEMDGQALVEAVRHSSRLCSVPILMVTSEEDQARLANVQQAGVSALCDKPFEPREVRRMVQNLLAPTS
jgi:two-component system chemotaxis response regulator CheY